MSNYYTTYTIHPESIPLTDEEQAVLNAMGLSTDAQEGPGFYIYCELYGTHPIEDEGEIEEFGPETQALIRKHGEDANGLLFEILQRIIKRDLGLEYVTIEGAVYSDKVRPQSHWGWWAVITENKLFYQTTCEAIHAKLVELEYQPKP